MRFAMAGSRFGVLMKLTRRGCDNARGVKTQRISVLRLPSLIRYARACRGHPRLACRTKGRDGAAQLYLAPLAGRGRRALARRARGALRESERVESLRPSPRKSGAREQKARGHLMLRPMGTSPAMTRWMSYR